MPLHREARGITAFSLLWGPGSLREYHRLEPLSESQVFLFCFAGVGWGGDSYKPTLPSSNTMGMGQTRDIPILCLCGQEP